MRFSQSVEGSKEMFLAILGHDLRTPLNAILASARLIIDIPENADLRADLSARIVRSARRMNQMVGDLLDFTRTRLGSGIPVTRDSTDMGELINEVVKELEVSRSERTVQVDLQVAEARGEWDSARIGQVLTNMIGNALDHGMAGNPVHVIIGGDEQEIRITIHNRGPAIPPERLKRIFHPMKSGEVKAGNRAAGQHGSLGLGLFIANEIIVAHHGRIEVQSSDADGTTFTIHLPRSSASVAHRPAH